MEAVVEVEAVGFSVDRVDGDQATSGLGCGIEDPLERVEQQLRAQSPAVEGPVEREAAEQVAGKAAVARAERATREIDARELRRSDRVVGDHHRLAWRGPDRRS